MKVLMCRVHGGLASIRHARRDYLGAEELLQKALAIRIKTLGRSIIKSRGRCFLLARAGGTGRLRRR